MYDENLLEDFLSPYDWRVAKDSTENYGMLLKKLEDFAQNYWIKCHQGATEKRRASRLNSNALNVERLLANSCRSAPQKDLQRFRQERISEAAEEDF